MTSTMVLLMPTCYVRIIIVLGLLRQALGLQSLPPSQVMTTSNFNTRAKHGHVVAVHPTSVNSS